MKAISRLFYYRIVLCVRLFEMGKKPVLELLCHRDGRLGYEWVKAVNPRVDGFQLSWLEWIGATGRLHEAKFGIQY